MFSTQLKKQRHGCERGFTLLELLVVLAIMGILAALAVAGYGYYRRLSFNARALSDLRNIMSAQEANYINSETYVEDLDDLEGFDTESPAVSVLLSGDDEGWSGKTYHPSGTNTYCYDSTSGESIVTVSGLDEDCP